MTRVLRKMQIEVPLRDSLSGLLSRYSLLPQGLLCFFFFVVVFNIYLFSWSGS